MNGIKVNGIKETAGGVCAAKGFKAGGIHCGIRKNKIKKDLAIIYSEVPAKTAGVFTTNLVKAAPVLVTMKHIENGTAQAVIVNSGIANTCCPDGIKVSEETCRLLGEALNVKPEDVIVSSTGVIGIPLPIEPIDAGIKALVPLLSDSGNTDAATAIMTTDTVMKEIAVEYQLGGKICHMGGMCKGSGMIHPNMATMLAYITTDAAISPEMLKKALKEDVKGSFNMLSIDGDTSTNDTLVVLANGMAGNASITEENADYQAFAEALNYITTSLVKKLAADGEGASKLLTCVVGGAADLDTARVCAKSVICSSLVKTAMFGADANWGRILCALGYAGADIDVGLIDVSYRSAKGEITVCRNGMDVGFDEAKAKEILLEKAVEILIDLNSGSDEATAWGCDLTYDYVKINGDYRT